jgi:hypothetical protein
MAGCSPVRLLEKDWISRLDDAAARRHSSQSWITANGKENSKDPSSSSKSQQVQPPVMFTGQTGSYMYMAPEVFREEQYDEKVGAF